MGFLFVSSSYFTSDWSMECGMGRGRSMLLCCLFSSLDDGWHLFWLSFLFVRICIERAGIQMTGRTNESMYDMDGWAWHDPAGTGDGRHNEINNF